MSHKKAVRILVVDDDREMVESYRALLETAGYRVSTAISGEMALGLAHEERPDVVLTDIGMPNMDGFELIHRLNDEFGRDTPPVMVCSAFCLTEREVQARGAKLFLQKPATAAALIHSVEALRRGRRRAPAATTRRRELVEEPVRVPAGIELIPRDVAGADVTREARPWLEWLRRYFDCETAGVFLLDTDTVIPLVVVGTERREPGLLDATLAAGVETGTSIVVADMAAHPSFGRVLGRSAEIVSFAGVPLVTSDGVRVGALSLADSHPGRFDADSLTTIEYLGRRAVSGLFDLRASSLRALPSPAPLLAQRTFETLLAAELRTARRFGEAVEFVLVALAPGVSASTCAEQVWRAAPRSRMAIGSMGTGRLGMFVRGAAEEAHRHAAFCLESGRAHGLLEAAGIAAVVSTAGLSRNAIVEIAESALTGAASAPVGSRVERIAVRTESDPLPLMTGHWALWKEPSCGSS